MKVTIYSKRDCLACKLVTTRFNEWGVGYEEVFEHVYSAPRLKYGTSILEPPITTSKLKKWASDVGLCQFSRNKPLNNKHLYHI